MRIVFEEQVPLISDSRSKAENPVEHRNPSAQVVRALIGLAVCSCASHDPHDVSVLLPEASIYAEPARLVQDMGYTIVYVDTIIGVFEALRWRGRRVSTRSGTVTGRADFLTVDVYEDAPARRVVVTVVAQTVTASRSLRDLRSYSLRATERPTTTVLRHAEALLRALGCEHVHSELRLTGAYGPRADVECKDTTPHGAAMSIDSSAHQLAANGPGS